MKPGGRSGAPEPEAAGIDAQLQVYARELHDLYQAEKQRRQELVEEKIVLEYKLRELGALNMLFQKHLEHRQEVEAAYRDLLHALHMLTEGKGSDLVSQLRRVVEAAEARLPDLELGEPGPGAQAPVTERPAPG